MTLKIFLAMSVWMLCVILVNIPPANSIRCYYKACFDISQCRTYGNIDCSEHDDKCGHASFITEAREASIWNCTRSSRDCNQERVCRRLTAAMARHNETVSACSENCCDGDLCNAPGSTSISLFILIVKYLP
ncbi:hypothetical protein OS493_020459 [Desmophyllum pertusum]|uniref:Uncharacterized protein n=1 Tax=Desmophyllum pertusum TaxID=174260 RepID=A0A9W9ZBW4_9CNID|nr:hypothetical protein OS493_020459 [Desmophyllum pertusum]